MRYTVEFSITVNGEVDVEADDLDEAEDVAHSEGWQGIVVKSMAIATPGPLYPRIMSKQFDVLDLAWDEVDDEDGEESA